MKEDLSKFTEKLFREIQQPGLYVMPLATGGGKSYTIGKLACCYYPKFFRRIVILTIQKALLGDAGTTGAISETTGISDHVLRCADVERQYQYNERGSLQRLHGQADQRMPAVDLEVEKGQTQPAGPRF